MTAAAWIERAGGSDAVRRSAEAVVEQVAHNDLFTPGCEVVVARAPGRLDVMGGIADYSGSLVLEWPLADATFVALQRDPPLTVTVVSGARRAQVPLPKLLTLDYREAQAFFAADPSSHWAAYVAGAYVVLAREQRVEFPDGARILVTSSVPEGRGVSSSAALEVAAMMAICAAYGVTLEPRRLAMLCQQVENLIAGAPCGVMDQMTAALGESGQLLALLCQPAELLGGVELPRGLALWGIDSGIRHSVGGSDYGTVRAAAFMGRRILEDLTGRRVDYLANVTPPEFASLEYRVPARLVGRSFLDRYHDVSDDVTTIDPGRVYPVRAATAHPIHEHVRVREFAKQLSTSADAERLGALMYESHASYSACGLGSSGTDTLVTFARRAGQRCGVYGAKITGGGSGGSVAVLGRADAGPQVHALAAEYACHSAHAARVFSGTSCGAVACGVCNLRV
jgi:galactokinase